MFIVFAIICSKMLLGALIGGIEIKDRSVLKNPGNFLFNEHKNLIMLLRNGWEKYCQRYQPPLKRKKNANICEYV